MEQIRTLEDWEKAVERSHASPVIVYKHSSTCHACRRSLSEVNDGVAYKEIKCPVYFLVVQESRDVSDRIADDLNVQHESPQALVLMGGRACYVADHNDIDVGRLASMVDHVGSAYKELMG